MRPTDAISVSNVALARPLSRAERAKAFVLELQAAIAVTRPTSKARALALINATLNAVEDRYSGIVWRPGMPFDRDSGRMLPLADDLYVGPALIWQGKPANVTVDILEADFYQTRGNDVLIAANGAFELWTLQRTASDGAIVPPVCLVRCPGIDGRVISRAT